MQKLAVIRERMWQTPFMSRLRMRFSSHSARCARVERLLGMARGPLGYDGIRLATGIKEPALFAVLFDLEKRGTIERVNFARAWAGYPQTNPWCGFQLRTLNYKEVDRHLVPTLKVAPGEGDADALNRLAGRTGKQTHRYRK